MSALPENPDLAWDLDEIINRERAMDFIMQFETTLCVYSGSVEQLYSSYHIYFPQEQERQLVILPDPSAFHDTFHRVAADSVRPTGLNVVPGELIGRHGLYLANVREDRTLGERQVPFEAGMRAIMKQRAADDPFLPVLAKGDLREFEDNWPVVHLHRISLAALPELSELDRSSLRNVIGEKLETLFLNLTKESS